MSDDYTETILWSGAGMAGSAGDIRAANPLEARRLELEAEADRQRVERDRIDVEVRAQDRRDRLTHQARLLAATSGRPFDPRNPGEQFGNPITTILERDAREARREGGITVTLPKPEVLPAPPAEPAAPSSPSQRKARAFAHRLIHGKGKCMCKTCISIRVAERGD